MSVRRLHRRRLLAGLSGAFRVAGQMGNDGRLLSSTFSSGYGAAVTYAGRYDSAGRPVRIDLGATALWEAVSQSAVYGAYDPLLRAKQVRSNGGLVETFRNHGPYTGRLSSQVVRSGVTQVWGQDQVVYFGQKLESYVESGTKVTFAYDAAGRLERASGKVVATNAPAFDRGYSFTDPGWAAGATLGSLERTLEYPASGGATAVEREYAPGTGGDRLVATRQGSTLQRSYLHDHAGRLVQKQDGSGAVVEQLGFDVEGHLKSVTRGGAVAETLAYGPSGELLFRKVGTKGTWYVGEFATVTADIAGTCPGTGCTATNVKVGAHVLLAGTRIATVRATDVLYYHRDERGSVVATTRTGGAIGVRYRYGEYGQLESAVGDEAGAGSELG